MTYGEVLMKLRAVPYDTLRLYGDGGDLTRFRASLSEDDRNEYDEWMDLRHKEVARNPDDLYRPYKYDKKRLKKLSDKFNPLCNTYFQERMIRPSKLTHEYFEHKKNGTGENFISSIDWLLAGKTFEDILSHES